MTVVRLPGGQKVEFGEWKEKSIYSTAAFETPWRKRLFFLYRNFKGLVCCFFGRHAWEPVLPETAMSWPRLSPIEILAVESAEADPPSHELCVPCFERGKPMIRRIQR